MRVDYLIHEGLYQKRRKEGWPGWMTPDQLPTYFDDLASWIEDIPKEPLSVLELGCGAGDRSLFLAERGYRPTGIDICPTAVDWARDKATERGLKATFVEGNVVELPFESCQFDWVLDGSCWHCIIGEDRERFVREAHRVLKPGGLFTGATMVGQFTYWDQEGYDPKTRLQEIDGVTVRYWASVEEVIQDLVEVGLIPFRQVVLNKDQQDRQEMLWIDARKV